MHLKHVGVWVFALMLALLLTVACNGGSPSLSESAKDQAIDEILGHPEVLGAAVGQDGKKLSLAVVMAFGSAESVAKDVGDNFVRTVKTLGPEPAPSKEIGEGDFDYFVTVIYPDRTVIARGAKVSGSSRLI
jgi:hypothetical protein